MHSIRVGHHDHDIFETLYVRRRNDLPCNSWQELAVRRSGVN